VDLSVRVFSHEVRLNSLDLLNIETLNISPSHLPGDGGTAWKLRVGIERDYLSSHVASNECFIESGVGKAVEIGSMTLYAMGKLRLQSPNNYSEQWLLTPNVGLLYEHDDWKTHFKISYPIQLDQYSQFKRTKYACEQRIIASKDYDLRLKFQKHLIHEISVSFSYYL
jgi:hypothetical protein